MKVFVLSKQGKALMPTTPRRARLWLRAHLAQVVQYDPFTIQLRFETSDYAQPVAVGVDIGSQTVGVANQGGVLWQTEVQLRTDISEKLTRRRSYRWARRSRKTRYRAPRFANRCLAGWPPPSDASKAAATPKAVCFVAKPVPIQRINGKRSEHRAWAPRKVRGQKIYELVEAGDQRGYIGGGRESGIAAAGGMSG